MKKRILIIALLVICMVSFGAGTLAYFAASSRAHNIITTGSVDITVEEWQQTDVGLVPYPKNPISVMPGKKVSKIVKIRNESAESYIRARVEVVFMNAEGKRSVMSAEEMTGLLHLDMNTDMWQQKADDRQWWYYAAAVSENAVTEPLFCDVVFDGEGMDNTFQNGTIEIHVAAQAVQTANNAATALTALGWPVE